ncbi:MAG: hypothetical protein IPO90_07900 [Flavobacteriales bacterium]|nr:hypothetical protein [Flavobacteriales bacterium]
MNNWLIDLVIAKAVRDNLPDLHRDKVKAWVVGAYEALIMCAWLGIMWYQLRNRKLTEQQEQIVLVVFACIVCSAVLKSRSTHTVRVIAVVC